MTAQELQQRRYERAMAQGADYEWLHLASGSVCHNPLTGKSYAVRSQDCTCGDWQNRVCGTEGCCKHQISLEVVRSLPKPAPIVREVELPKRCLVCGAGTYRYQATAKNRASARCGREACWWRWVAP